jgi:hypothetical protein
MVGVNSRSAFLAQNSGSIGTRAPCPYSVAPGVLINAYRLVDRYPYLFD